MPSFTLVINSKNIANRVQWLQGVLGPVTGGSSSRKTKTVVFSKGGATFSPRTTKPETRLAITHELLGSTESFLEFISKLKRIFPEMMFESRFIDEFRRRSKHYRYVCARGFLSVSRQGVAGQDVEFFLTNAPQKDEVVIAQDSLDPRRQQVVFVRTWGREGDFVENVLEPWLVSGKVKLVDHVGEASVPFFVDPFMSALSDSRQRWPGLPLPSTIYAQSWSQPHGQETPNENWAIVSSVKTYADLRHAFAFLLERGWEYIRYNCIFCLPDPRGRILQLSVEPRETNYSLVVKCETTVALALKVSCLQGSEVMDIFNADSPTVETFQIDYVPTEVKAELLAPGLVDRLSHHTTTGVITTSVQPRPSIAITTEIGLPVQNQVLADATIMITAYARFFILENTLRNLVKEKFVKAFGAHWANNLTPVLFPGKAPAEIARMKQIMSSNQDQILEHIYYRDLNNIVDKFWHLFQGEFQDRDRTLLKLKELEDLRNDIAHNRVLDNHDIKRIEVYYMDLLSGVQ